jgi:oligopeptide/dipeptide ABC transporter ATP-binding protein
MRLNPAPPAVITRGAVLFEGEDLLKMNMAAIRRIRGKKIGMIFQEPSSFLNPVMRTGLQIAEQLMYHERMTKRQALAKTRDVLEEVELGTDDRVLNSFPHELSGGMKQRAMIAIAIACRPALLLADEPTTALDVTIQKQIISLLKKLRKELSISILFVSHDLWVVQEIADAVSVIYAGEIIERGTRDEIFHDPRHPYTQGLVDSIPSLSHRGQRLKTIQGSMHSPFSVPSGCPFHPRCPIAQPVCRERQSDSKRFSGTHWCLCHMAAGNGTRRPQIHRSRHVSAPLHITGGGM